jgi:FkbM family methyltransferase
MIRTDAKSWPPNRLAKKWYRLWYRVRERLTKDVEVVDGNARYRFRCENMMEFTRAMSLFTKEAGTCEWLKSEVKPGQVFYDIGANIGIYTILAARLAGETGKVFSFEPHSANFTRLLENIAVNNLQDVVTPCNVALNNEDGFFPFNYLSSEAASSNSQLLSARSVHEVDFKPRVSELKRAASIDGLVDSGLIDPPDHVKIDVDGNELLILNGMKKVLEGKDRPKSIQVEINDRYKDGIWPFMESLDYALSDKHYTASGLKLIARGGDPEAYTYNAIFRPGS